MHGGTDHGAIEDDLEAFGLRLDGELKDSAIEVWPEHWEPMNVAEAMMSQMAVGMAGPTGWRYESLPVVFRMLSIPLARQREMFADLRSIEADVLATIRAAK